MDAKTEIIFIDEDTLTEEEKELDGDPEEFYVWEKQNREKSKEETGLTR